MGDSKVTPLVDSQLQLGITSALQSVGLDPTSDTYWPRLIEGLTHTFDRHPIAMRMTCPECNVLHIDEGEFATKPHHTHACQHCGNVWRPAIVNTVGVQFLPGFKNDT